MMSMTRNISSQPASASHAAQARTLAEVHGSERGSSVLELAFMLPFLLFLLIAAADFGRAYYLMIEVADAAHTGALYGTQNPTDTTGMQNAAKGNAGNIPSGLTATATYGCECSDGTSAVASCTSTPSCTVNAVNYVQVITSYTYSPLLPYPGAPSSLTLQGKSRMRASQ
jgi:Flp pilus assembly protein TadG